MLSGIIGQDGAGRTPAPKVRSCDPNVSFAHLEVQNQKLQADEAKPTHRWASSVTKCLVGFFRDHEVGLLVLLFSEFLPII